MFKNLEKFFLKNRHLGGQKNENFEKIRSDSKSSMKTALGTLLSNLKSVKKHDFLGQTYQKLVKTFKNPKKIIFKNRHLGGRKNENFQKIRSDSKTSMKTALEALLKNLELVKQHGFSRPNI